MLKSDLERQASFERKQIKVGLEQLQSNTKNLEDKTYSSATILRLSNYKIQSNKSFIPSSIGTKGSQLSNFFALSKFALRPISPTGLERS